jgi:phosphomannomutase
VVDLGAIFKAYDVRGVYPHQLDEEAARRIGAAFAHFAAAPSIVLGRDMRISSEPLSAAFSEGIRSQGVDVVDVGLVSTDALYFASGRYNAPGAMFTASHNPPRYNGIKFCLAGAAPVGQGTGLEEIRRLADEGLVNEPLRAGAETGSVRQADVLAKFVEHVLSFVDVGKLRPLTVCVDAANGMAGAIVPPIFDRLPFKLVPLFFELDGTFPNHPADPIQPTNLRVLQKAVIEHGAYLGMAFDGDADRVFLVDERGEPVSGSLTTALVASRVLGREPGATIVYNLICSHVVPEIVRELGGTPVRTRVGHSFIKKVMAETGAAFGGEHSGHYYFRDNFRADSGIICAMFVLEALSSMDQPLSQVIQPFRRYWDSGEINTEVADPAATLEEVAAAFASGTQDRTDGLTVEYPDWWFNVRPSNTEPLLRLNVEASGQEVGQRRTDEVLEVIQS